MDRNNRFYPKPQALRNEFTGRVSRAILFEEFSQLRRIHIVGAFIHVDEVRASTRLRNRFRRCDKGVWHRYDCVPGLDPGGQERKTQRVGSAGHANRVLGLAECAKIFVKFLNRTASDKRGRMQCRPEHIDEFLLHLLVRRYQIEERNLLVSPHESLPGSLWCLPSAELAQDFHTQYCSRAHLWLPRCRLRRWHSLRWSRWTKSLSRSRSM